MSETWYEKRITDITITIEIPVRVYFIKYGTEEYWQYLEKELLWEIKELQEFIRDHRSRDHYNLETNKVYSVVCKYCGHECLSNVGEHSDIDIEPTCCNEAMKERGFYLAELEGNV